jgi:hypothetical protein
VCWMCPRVCSGRSSTVLNRSPAIQRALHGSHLSDSFPFVILWIQVFVGNVWEFVRNILLWSCDLTEVIFIHSPSSSRPCPSRRKQSTVNVDVIGPFWCAINNPSSLDLTRFLDSLTFSRHVLLSLILLFVEFYSYRHYSMCVFYNYLYIQTKLLKCYY